MKHSLLLLFISLNFLSSCTEQATGPENQVTADFSWEIDSLNFYQVHFTPKTENAIAHSWDFGNGDTSTIENPSYTYQNGGLYDVSLTTYGKEGQVDSKTQTVEILEPPTSPIKQLAGMESKKWKLYRLGSAASLGPDSSQPDKWWEGFYNDGSRNCLYKHEFTFSSEMSFEFNDHNSFWGDASIWPPQSSFYEVCFEPTDTNMIVNGNDLSPWLSGTHEYKLDTEKNMIILSGKGAWIGFPFLGTSMNHGTNLPDSIAVSYSVEEFSSYDLLTINFDHGQAGYWTFNYVHYDDWQDEPALIE